MAFRGYLKQSAAVNVTIGPFLDAIDGQTAKTALTIAQADVRLSKNSAAFAQKGDATSCTHQENGMYSCPVNATDTGTIGTLTLVVFKSGALPIRHDYEVISAAAFDAMTGNDRTAMGVVTEGTAQAGTGTTIQLAAAVSFADNILNGCIVTIRSGTGAGQSRYISGYTSATKTATIDPAWTTNPGATSVYEVWAAPPSPTSAIPSVNVATMANNVVTAAVIATDAIDNDAVAANAVTEIQTGLATSAQMSSAATTLTNIDTNVTTLLGSDQAYKKNVAVTAFVFYMELTGGTPGIGLTVTTKISKDGGAFAATGSSAVEISDGWYKVNIAQAEMNADEIGFLATATGCKQRNLKIRTQS